MKADHFNDKSGKSNRRPEESATRNVSGNQADLFSRPLREYALQRPDRSGPNERQKHMGHMSDES